MPLLLRRTCGQPRTALPGLRGQAASRPAAASMTTALTVFDDLIGPTRALVINLLLTMRVPEWSVVIQVCRHQFAQPAVCGVIPA
jgi:hypothetical protein